MIRQINDLSNRISRIEGRLYMIDRLFKTIQGGARDD